VITASADNVGHSHQFEAHKGIAELKWFAQQTRRCAAGSITGNNVVLQRVTK
jgi:hypothetical protein